MARIDTVLRLIDRYTTPMRSIYRSTVSAGRAASTTTRSVNALQRVYNTFSFSNFSAGIVTVNQGLQLAQQVMQGFGAITEQIDKSANIKARIDLMNDGLQTTKELQDDIFNSAQRAKAGYEDMADSISKIGLLAGDAFGNSSEIVRFAEIIQKSFKISGADTQMKQATMLQLTQALGSGRLQGDEFRSITENAPIVARAISKYMGVSIGELKKLSSQGVITSDIIKNAMFSANEQISKDFENMPSTFGDVMTKIKNVALKELSPTFEKIIELLNSPSAMRGIELIMQGVGLLADGIYFLLETAIQFSDFVSSNWSIIEPILVGIAGAILGLIIPALAVLIPMLWGMVAPVLATAAGFLVANLPIMLISGAIALLIYLIVKYGEETTKVLEFVGGIFGGFAVFLQNIVSRIGNYFLAFGDFLVNVFNNPIGAIKKLFMDMVIFVFGLFNSLFSGIEHLLNAIPGVEINVSASLDRIESDMKRLRDNYALQNDLVNKTGNGLKQIDIETGVEIGQMAGRFLGNKISGAVDSVSEKLSFAKNIGGVIMPKNNNINKIGSVGVVDKIKDDVNISQEDLKLMREMAEMNNIQNFITMTPKISTRIGTINNDADSDRLLGEITEKIQREMEASMEGV